MKISIKGLRSKVYGGARRYYWEPHPLERKAGWSALTLGTDLDTAMSAARARNKEIEIWKAGGARPREVKKFIKPATLGAVIKRYREEQMPELAVTTQRTYNTGLNRIDGIFGDIAITAISRAHVRQFRDALMKPKDRGGAGHNGAHGTLRVLRTLCQWAIDKLDMQIPNPAINFDLATPPPRDQIWDVQDNAAFTAAAIDLRAQSLAFALELGEYIGQREADLLKLQESQWREIQGLDREMREALASDTGPDAGKVMGIFIRQGKTKRWVGVPVSGGMRLRIEAAIAANRRRAKQPGSVAVTNLIVNDDTGLPWVQVYFIRKFAEVKDLAVRGFTGRDGTVHAAYPALADLQFRDLRRTAVVRLGELGLEDALISAITGHKLETIKNILEVYMPRTTKMAARAIVSLIGDADRTAAADRDVKARR